MPLKVRLKPNERIIIAGAAIRNGSTPTDLIIENKVAVLREKDILRETQASSPARRIYFVVQLMYLDPEGLSSHHKMYWKLIADLLKAVPSAIQLIELLSGHILRERFYEALKVARKLIGYERSILTKTATPALINKDG